MTDCLFCKIASGEIPSKKVYEDAHTFAFLDINPRNPGHTLVIPKRHAQDIFSIEEHDAVELMKSIKKVAAAVQKATGAKGISITQSNGQLAGQLIPHIHFHIIPRTEAEKGLGLESVLPVKKQDEASLESMARKISENMPQAQDNTGEPGHMEEEPGKDSKERMLQKPEDAEISFDDF